ncbi:M48 family metalloprotease [Agaribacterium haliotis]|uniref:M48 family metalloprotease n=1 Tax=Agaribacterium haliotis TaxID=2013869 RepID=UPI000BB54937|nr:M48 family metalloprotease [Agaribacterium haliotis]
MLSRTIVQIISLLFLSVGSASTVLAKDLNLPDLGGASGGLISTAQEYQLGQQWIRVFRSQTRTSGDAFLQDYTENLVKSLANYSELSDKRLDIIVVENPTLNAFAVPGGVIGVNTGLFNYAETEQQFASVMAHELAHLSQRHFARRIDEQKNNSIPNIAAMIASILVLATAGGDAGVAAIATAQGVAIDKQLSFSRDMEREADRVGMATMVRADMNPYAMPDMFEHMLHASRFQRRPPEFLITHPLTETRVSDAKLRAQQYPRKHEIVSDDYQLAKVRAELAVEKNPAAALKRYQGELNLRSRPEQVARYGLGLAQLRARKYQDALKNFDILVEQDPNRIHYLVGQAQALGELERHEQALESLEAALDERPNNHPLNMALAELYLQSGDYDKGEALLKAHSKRRPKDEHVWYQLAEAHGLAGNILDVHTARAEYYVLNGIYSKAENHLRSAMRMLEPGDKRRIGIDERLKDIQRMKRQSLI